MKALVITGSRADRNGLEVVHEALLKAGHESQLAQWSDGALAIIPDVAVIGGDRIEILEAAVWLSRKRVPIAHIAGGDITEGSADDRYRDAISKLACMHFVTNHSAYWRFEYEFLARHGDFVLETGSPAIDRIKQTPVLDKRVTWLSVGLSYLDANKPTALVCVHPNTSGKDAPEYEAWVTRIALARLKIQAICLGANADYGQDDVNQIWFNAFKHKFLTGTFVKNVSPQLYYSLMTHCDVMVGNSSAGYYEAPSFGLPVLQVGDRQEGRVQPDNVCALHNPDAISIANAVERLLLGGRIPCENPYGDGNSAPRIVKALEENAWRWL